MSSSKPDYASAVLKAFPPLPNKIRSSSKIQTSISDDFSFDTRQSLSKSDFNRGGSVKGNDVRSYKTRTITPGYQRIVSGVTGSSTWSSITNQERPNIPPSQKNTRRDDSGKGDISRKNGAPTSKKLKLLTKQNQTQKPPGYTKTKTPNKPSPLPITSPQKNYSIVKNNRNINPNKPSFLSQKGRSENRLEEFPSLLSATIPSTPCPRKSTVIDESNGKSIKVNHSISKNKNIGSSKPYTIKQNQNDTTNVSHKRQNPNHITMGTNNRNTIQNKKTREPVRSILVKDPIQTQKIIKPNSKIPKSTNIFNANNKRILDPFKKNTLLQSVVVNSNCAFGFGKDSAGNANVLISKRGRQKIGPAKKKLTTLKKKVLHERLAQWREHEIILKKTNEVPSEERFGLLSQSLENTSSTTVHLFNYINQDELKAMDEDEYDEIISDLRDLALKVGNVQDVHIPSPCTLRHKIDMEDITEEELKRMNCLLRAFVLFEKVSDAIAAQACWDKIIIGGNQVRVGIVPKQAMQRIIKITDSECNQDRQNINDIKDWRHHIVRLSQDELFFREDNNQYEEVSTHKEGSIIYQTSMILGNILTKDDFDDDECLKESVEDVILLASQFGFVVKEKVKVDLSGDDLGQIHIIFHGEKDVAKNAAIGMDRMILGGEKITAKCCNKIGQVTCDNKIASSDDNNTIVHGVANCCSILIANVLSQDDYDDEDCLEESRSDFLNLASSIGAVQDMKMILDGINKGCVSICFKEEKVAQQAINTLNGKVIGGSPLSVSLLSDGLRKSSVVEKSSIIFINNILSQDDFDDEECLKETEIDIRDMASKFGTVKDISIDLVGDSKGRVSICYAEGKDVALQAVTNMNGMIIGGSSLSVSMSADIYHDSFVASKESPHNNPKNADLFQERLKDEGLDSDKVIVGNPLPERTYSGKIIPEIYAQCKRVPKIPNCAPRKYISELNDESAIPLILEMLGELMRLQIRSKDDKNARSRRRLVMGLREVARGIRAHKVKMVIMANNLDQYGAIDSKLQEILDLAREENLPVIFELNKRKLGKALGKNIKVSVVGVQSADGAYVQFKQLKKLTGHL